MKGVVLAAGHGTRLRPLTELLPKALCPVANRPLLEHAIERLGLDRARVAVNVHAHREKMEAHLAEHAPEVHVSVEAHEALGTAGALGRLREWIDGAPVVLTNADAVTAPDLAELLDGWDGERLRLLVTFDEHQPDFHGIWHYAGACLMPWSAIEGLSDRPSDLYTERWQPAQADGSLELVPTQWGFTDCGTPLRYLAANLRLSRGRSVIGDGAVVEGTVEASVVWPGAHVGAGEHLRHAIRMSDGRTVTPLERGGSG